MTIKANKHRLNKSDRGGIEFWSRRPMAGSPHTSDNKKICRRLERKIRKRELKKEL